MNIGQKIKEYRVKKGITQKDLADQLHVTYQAVSRWENDDAEPSFDTLKDICNILECSTDDLFEIEKKVQSEDTKPTIEAPEQKHLLGICGRCGASIYDENDYHRTKEHRGRGSVVDIIICGNCHNQELLKIKKAKEEERKKIIARRIHSFIWPSIIAAIFIVFSIINFNANQTNDGITFLVLGIFGFTFVATMILDNTFIPDLWMEVSSWGFVRLPGVIFDLSIDGLIFLIVVKGALFLFGLALALVTTIIATLLAAFLSIFVYPFSIVKSFKEGKLNEKK